MHIFYYLYEIYGNIKRKEKRDRFRIDCKVCSTVVMYYKIRQNNDDLINYHEF